MITTSYPKASHHELDEERTTEGNTYHPHMRSVAVEPGTIQEYVIRLHPFPASFLPGHRQEVELSTDPPLADEAQLAVAARRVPPAGGPARHAQDPPDAVHPSRLVLPFSTSGGDTAYHPITVRLGQSPRSPSPGWSSGRRPCGQR